MSVTNKVRDRDEKGRINRKYTKNQTMRSQIRPSWFVKAHMTRPRRRANKRLCLEVVKGADADAIVWPLDRKPKVDWI